MTFTQSAKAIQATIYLGNIPLDVYQMPDSSYKLYAESVTRVVDKEGRDLLNFLHGKSLQALPFKDYNLVHAERVEVEGRGGFIKPIPVKLATSYWLYRAIKGNVKAQALAQACMVESIERRADKAFSIKRSEAEYNQRFGELWEEVVAENRLRCSKRGVFLVMICTYLWGLTKLENFRTIWNGLAVINALVLAALESIYLSRSRQIVTKRLSSSTRSSNVANLSSVGSRGKSRYCAIASLIT